MLVNKKMVGCTLKTLDVSNTYVQPSNPKDDPCETDLRFRFVFDTGGEEIWLYRGHVFTFNMLVAFLEPSYEAYTAEQFMVAFAKSVDFIEAVDPASIHSDKLNPRTSTDDWSLEVCRNR